MNDSFIHSFLRIHPLSDSGRTRTLLFIHQRKGAGLKLILCSRTESLLTIVSPMNSPSSSNNENDDYRLPSATRKRSGWAGEEMELEHHRQTQQQHRLEDSSAVAVDLNQFRNTQVGSGYQAKGVIRQRGGGSNEESFKERVAVLDLSKPSRRSSDDGDDHDSRKDDDDNVVVGKKTRTHNSRKSKRRKKEMSKSKSKHVNDREANGVDTSVERYLQCKGIRDFRKEIDKILQEASAS